MSRIYLGDQVYAELDLDMIKLFTWDGLRETNIIFLEPEVVENLLQYIKIVKEVKVKHGT